MIDGDADPETLRRSLLVERLVAAGSLAEGLAHEVHNPFNVARLQLTVLQRRLVQPDCQPATLQPVTELVDLALRRLEVLFDDLIFLLRPGSAQRALLVAGDRCPGVMTLVRADTDQTRTRLALDLVLEMPPLDGRLLLLLATLWPSFVSLGSEQGKLSLKAIDPDTTS